MRVTLLKCRCLHRSLVALEAEQPPKRERPHMSFQILAKTALLASSALVTMIATPVRAADSPASAVDGATTPVAANGAVAPNANQNDGLGDIVVTATKRETNLQDTPIAISVIDSQTIKDRHVQSLLDLADGAVPSLRVATFEARQSALTVGIRGIVPFDANQTARDQGVGVYIDGVYLGRQQGLNAALFDVARIEVLRGPQGTLFGRNTEGGALSIVTAQPTGEFDGRVSSGIGNYGSHFGEAHIDLPAIAPGIGNVAIKLDAVEQHQDPTVKNPLAGQAGWNQYERVGGRIQAKWTPFDGFSALFSYDRSRDENTPNYSQLINYNPNGLPCCHAGADYRQWRQAARRVHRAAILARGRQRGQAHAHWRHWRATARSASIAHRANQQR